MENIEENQNGKTREMPPLPAPVDVGMIRVSTTLQEIVEAKKERDELIKRVFLPNVHFGVIDGTDKPTLYQNGAAEATYWYKCYPEYKILSQQHDPSRTNEYLGFKWTWNPDRKKNEKSRDKVKLTSVGYHGFQIECRIVHRQTGQVVGTGVGACSTAESKYVSRPNDCENTVLKMAKKRAFVDAALITFALGSVFTQDVEDLPEEVLNWGRKTASPPKKAAAQPAKAATPPPPKTAGFDPKSVADMVKAGVVKTTTYKGVTYLWAEENDCWNEERLIGLGFQERVGDGGVATGQFCAEATYDLAGQLLGMWSAGNDKPVEANGQHSGQDLKDMPEQSWT